MTFLHKLKLIIPRFTWWRKAINNRKDFLRRKNLHAELTTMLEESEKKYLQLHRQQANANLTPTPLTQLHNLKGKVDLIKELLW